MSEEIKVVHEVYLESLRYSDFILRGKPIYWSVPEEPDTIISAIRLKNNLLVMRTDFNDSKEIRMTIDQTTVRIPVMSSPTIIKIR